MKGKFSSNDGAKADASGTSPSRELHVDIDDGKDFRNILSRPRSPKQDGGHARALGDGASSPPSSPLHFPTKEMEIADEDEPLAMPASQLASAFKEMEEGSMNLKKSPTAAAAPSSLARLNPTPPLVPPASARGGLEMSEDDMLPVLAVQTASAYKEMEQNIRNSIDEPLPPMPAVQAAVAYKDTEQNINIRALDEPPPPMHLMPAGLKRAIFEDESEVQTANETMQTTEEDNFSPPEDPREDAEYPSGNPPLYRAQSLPVPAPPHQDIRALEERRSDSAVMLPMRPPPRLMLPYPDIDDETNASLPTLQVIEATLYEQDPVVYLGTPVEDNDLRPWWKKQRLPIAIAVMGLVAGLAIALVATLGFRREPVIASSQPSETQSFLPSHAPSQSSPPSEIPSLFPTLHPSQSGAPSSVRSAPPSTTLVPSSSPSSSSSTPPSASTSPTAFCFQGAINIFTDSYSEDTSWTLSRITTDGGVPTSKVVRKGAPENASSPHTDEVCLERGEYEFTIYDRFGNGICCDDGPGRFELVMDGSVVLEGGEFGLSQTVHFSLPIASLSPSRSAVPSRSLIPTARPSLSSGPSSQVPSLGPTLTRRPSSSPSLPLTAPPSTYWSSLIWEQKGQTINGEASSDESGRSLALSGDGLTMAVGSPGTQYNTNRPGYVKVYRREDSTSSWKILGQKIEGTANGNRFGVGLALSEDGRTLAIGAPGHFSNSVKPGYVRVYQIKGDAPGSSWKQLGQDITAEAGGGQFGWSIALSANGRTLAIGDYLHHDIAGLVRIFGWDEDGPSWKQLGQDIDGEAPGDESGHSVDLSSDGMTVAIGAPGNDGDDKTSGKVRVYRREGDGLSWEQLGQDIDGEAPGDLSGYSVSLSADGRTLAIGAPHNDGINGARSGHARVYYINEAGTSWEQLGQDMDGEAASNWSGESLSLSADGKTVAIGARRNNDTDQSSGHVRVYRMEDGPNWIQVGRDIDGTKSMDNAGKAVSLSADGKIVAIGSHWHSGSGTKSGHVRVFGINIYH